MCTNKKSEWTKLTEKLGPFLNDETDSNARWNTVRLC